MSQHIKPIAQNIPFSSDWILHIDSEFLIVNKPSGLLSVPGRNLDPLHSLIGQVQIHYADALIVHRLDMDTSGIMVLARNPQAHKHLSQQFQNRQTQKHYQAICFGMPSLQQGYINLPMRCDWERRPLQIIDFQLGKSAQTQWRLVEQQKSRCKIELKPITGRSHQLRLHMKSLGHPILGDNLYADTHSFEMATRLQLHAADLQFYHPQNGEPCKFHCQADFW